jgi:hypothetical protein
MTTDEEFALSQRQDRVLTVLGSNLQQATLSLVLVAAVLCAIGAALITLL